ncbi:hypothetical protein M9H77_29877 [Catharanthus roseus]|uniref:Uncharacterized protein n=1 Tax=Catharanthus roseus TaxID=4058 RepID=A0ACB9ZVP5_CATRO|nr:hypothetical protein M9H77_29877 [Catharanthus roseus]
MLYGSGYFLASWVRRGPPARVAQGGLVGTPRLVTYSVFKWCVRWFMKNRTFVRYPPQVETIRRKHKKSEIDENRSCRQKGSTYHAWQVALLLPVGVEKPKGQENKDLP